MGTINACVLGTQLASCHAVLRAGPIVMPVPSALDVPSKSGSQPPPWGLCPPCPGATCLSWCWQCLPLSPCHLWLCWLWGKRLAGALLCLPTPHPASPPACWGGWGQCPPFSLRKSINLGKHSQDWRALSVCLSVALPVKSWGAQAPGISSAQWGLLEHSPLPWVHWAGGRCCGQDPARAGCGAAPREPPPQISLGVPGEAGAASGTGIHPPISSCHSAAPPNPGVGAGSVRVWAGSLHLPARAACRLGLHLLRALTPLRVQHPGVLDLSQSHGVPPAPAVFPWETRAVGQPQAL